MEDGFNHFSVLFTSATETGSVSFDLYGLAERWRRAGQSEFVPTNGREWIYLGSVTRTHNFGLVSWLILPPGSYYLQMTGSTDVVAGGTWYATRWK